MIFSVGGSCGQLSWESGDMLSLEDLKNLIALAEFVEKEK